MSTGKKKNERAVMTTFVMCRIALFSALFFVLKFVGISAGNLRINFASLPVIIAALLFGAPEAMIVAAIGEFISQIVSYGFTYSTVLWLLSPVSRALIIGLWAHFFFSLPNRKSGVPWHKSMSPAKIVICYVVCIFAAVVATVVNTACMAACAKLEGYYTHAYVFGSLVLRFVTGMVTAVAVTTAAIPLSIALKSVLPVRMTSVVIGQKGRRKDPGDGGATA